MWKLKKHKIIPQQSGLTREKKYINCLHPRKKKTYFNFKEMFILIDRMFRIEIMFKMGLKIVECPDTVILKIF